VYTSVANKMSVQNQTKTAQSENKPELKTPKKMLFETDLGLECPKYK